MTISDRIFEKLEELSMPQKTFSDKTGISPSTISEWKKKHTNPSADKILAICRALDVSPEWLLSGIDARSDKDEESERYIVNKDTEMGFIIESYGGMSSKTRQRLIGYIEALNDGNRKH